MIRSGFVDDPVNLVLENFKVFLIDLSGRECVEETHTLVMKRTRLARKLESSTLFPTSALNTTDLLELLVPPRVLLVTPTQPSRLE